MNTIRHKWIILFFRILGWVNISASIIVLLSLLGGGSGIRFFLPLESSAYTLIIISGILGGLLLLGFAALLEHQADLVELQLKQTEFLEKLSKVCEVAKEHRGFFCRFLEVLSIETKKLSCGVVKSVTLFRDCK